MLLLLEYAKRVAESEASVSEPLSELPFFSLEPVEGSPIVLSLKKATTTPLSPPLARGDLEGSQGGELYEDTFTVNALTPHGPTTYKFSGKDIIGNRGNSQGAGLTIDSRGPIASITSPVTLLQITDSPVEVKITFDEVPVGMPVLEVKDSKGVSVPITAMTLLSGRNWTGFVNSSSLSDGNAEFILKEVKDSLGNISTKVASGKKILLYKDSVPAPSVPTGLTANTARDGKITLRWDNVTSQLTAVTYNIYRRAEGETSALQVGWAVPTNTLADIPPIDGKYYYSVTSLGLLNSESAKSAEVIGVSDRTGPPTPTGLLLSLDGNGVKAVWTTTPAPPYQGGEQGEAPAYYRLYRSDGGIATISGLTPVATVITTSASDPSPTSSKRFYAVTAMDSLGNESAPSETKDIVFPVGPVRNLLLTKIDSGKPSLSWQAPEGSIQGYYIYRNGQKVNQNPTLSTTYSDGYYSGGTITYGISAVDGYESESPTREVTLPDLTIGLKEGTTLRRGVLETVNIVASGQWSVAGSQNMTIDAIALKIGSLPESTLNGPFTLTPGTLEVKKVAATEANAPAEIAVVITAIMNPSPGTTIKITKTSTANVMGSGTALEIFNDPLVRGATAKVRLKVNNLGSARTEIITSQNNGSTGQVRINLRDQDGNLLASGNLNQRVGSAIVDSGSYAMARIEPGNSFLTDPITFNVPTSAPYKVIIEAIIDNTYYHYNQADQVTAPGFKQSVESFIVETAYRATALPEKMVYKQGETVKITGQAISNAVVSGQGSGASEQPVPNVPVKLGISVKGFDRFFTVTTDNDGNFTHTFTPSPNEAGLYSIWAIHPDLMDRTVQAQFSIIGMEVSPLYANIRMLKNSSYEIPVTIRNFGGTDLTGLTLTAASGSGITASAINSGDDRITPGENQTITFRLTSGTPDTGYASLTINTAEGLSQKVEANITLVSALPIINTSPSYIDTGLVRGTQKIQTFTIINTGLDTLKNARLEGPNTSWMSLTVDKTLGDIPANQGKSVGIMIRPGETVPQGVYNDRITIYADNHIPYTYNIQVTVTSSAVGNVLFDVLNEFMEDISGASITVQHQQLTELIYNLRTASDGTVSQFDIPEGRYSFNITAPGHRPYGATFTISPGLTTTIPVALEMTLVEVSWSVVPTTIQDKYEIKVTQTFETNVPAPVLIVEPASITLPEMQPGQVFNGEFTVTNYGLIAVDDVNIDFPTSFGEYDIEILTSSIPKRISAMQKVTVPYRIVRRILTASIASSLSDEIKGYGGGNCITSFSLTIRGTAIICPNSAFARTVTRVANFIIGLVIDCPQSTGGGGAGGGGYVYTGSGSGTGSGQGGGGSIPGGSPTPINTANPCECKDDCTRNDRCKGNNVCVKQKCISNNPIQDLEQCPNRVDNPDRGKELNGCSVPERLQFLVASPDDPMGGGENSSFRPVCDFHDMCYGSCRVDKSICDATFATMTADICRSAYTDQIDLAKCLFYATEYGAMVMVFGDDAYNNRQKQGCNCCP